MRMQIPLFGEDAIFNLLPYKTKQDKALKVLHGQTNKVIEARREELKKAKITTLNDSSDIGKYLMNIKIYYITCIDLVVAWARLPGRVKCYVT